MKKINDIVLNTINIVLTIMLIVNFISYDKAVDMAFVFKKDLKINSKFLLYKKSVKAENNKVIVLEKEPIKLEDEEIKIDIKDTPTIEIPKVPVIEEPIYKIIETFVGTISGYGPDCYGCTSNKTASGYYVGNGNIYYDDAHFNKVRIVSADSKYPFGTIVKIKGYNEDIVAIVLDRGAAIGIGKRIQFDLLFETEKAASVMGLKNNLTFEILRIGY
ncbi:MAG: hypothetical protein RSE91_03820 [Bacilli bacterium]